MTITQCQRNYDSMEAPEYWGEADQMDPDDVSWAEKKVREIRKDWREGRDDIEADLDWMWVPEYEEEKGFLAIRLWVRARIES